MSESYDFIVIGGGSAGYAGASTASQLGMKTLVIEGGEQVGGLCILRGCMPSKALLETGHRAEAIRHAEEFGISADYHGADAASIVARKRRLIAEFAEYRQGQLESGRFDFIRGWARFLDPHTLSVTLPDGGERQISGRAFLIATGSKISRPHIGGLEEAGYWTSDEMLDAEKLPPSVCILGGGAIALEAASYYLGLGIETTIIQRSAQVLGQVDADVAEAITVALEKRGARIFRGTQLSHVTRENGLAQVHFAHEGAEKVVEAAQIIQALGRVPRIDDLGLAAAGANCARGVVTGVTQQCGPDHIFAAGDVSSPHEVVHVAIQQGEIAARNAARVLGMLAGDLEKIHYDLKLFVVFTHPEVASVGLTEEECRAQGIDAAAARYLFADHGKAMIRGTTDGFVKLIVERSTNRLLGGACVGPEASELIHEIVVALRFGASARQLATIPHYHPTLSEIWTYPAEELAAL